MGSINIESCWRRVFLFGVLLLAACDNNDDHTQPAGGPVPLDGVVQIATGGGFALALREDGTVWGWGKNNLGQLGVDPAELAYSTTAIQVQGLEDIAAIDAGLQHALAITQNGEVYAWGGNHFGQVGAGYERRSSRWRKAYFSPMRVALPSGRYVAVAAGALHTLALHETGVVFSWGDYLSGLGYGVDVAGWEDVTTPIRIPDLENIVAIAAGWWGSAWVDQEGKLFTVGKPVVMGHDPAKDVAHWLPALVEGLPPVTRVAMYEAAYAVSADGCLWDLYYPPQRLDQFCGVRSVDVADGHTVYVVTDTGELLGFGSADNGLLGEGGDEQVSYYDADHYIRLDIPMKLKDVKIGDGDDDFAIGLDEEGQVWSWGGNYFGQLGDSTTQTRTTPDRVLMDVESR